MNGTSLKVRCLASTRISESTCQEQESKEEVKGEVHDQEASEEFGIEHLPIRGGRNLQHVSNTEAQSDSTVDHCSDASSEESEDDSDDDLNEKSSDDSADSCSNASDDETSHDSGKKHSHATSSAE
jgi:hypothetical protein